MFMFGPNTQRRSFMNPSFRYGLIFRTALRRSGLNFNGHLSPHDFRDVFRTEATIKGADYDAREFALGHQIDPRGYDKCYADLPWLWKEISKIYAKAPTESTHKLEEKVTQLELAVRMLQNANPKLRVTVPNET